MVEAREHTTSYKLRAIKLEKPPVEYQKIYVYDMCDYCGVTRVTLLDHEKGLKIAWEDGKCNVCGCYAVGYTYVTSVPPEKVTWRKDEHV